MTREQRIEKEIVRCEAKAKSAVEHQSGIHRYRAYARMAGRLEGLLEKLRDLSYSQVPAKP